MGERQEVDYKTEEIQKTVLVCDNCSADVGYKEEGASLKEVYFDPEFATSSMGIGDMRPHADKDWRMLEKMDFEYDSLRTALDNFPQRISYDGKEEWCEGCIEGRGLSRGIETYGDDSSSRDRRIPIPSLSSESKAVIFGSAIFISFMIAIIGMMAHPIILFIFLPITIVLVVAAIEFI